MINLKKMFVFASAFVLLANASSAQVAGKGQLGVVKAAAPASIEDIHKKSQEASSLLAQMNQTKPAILLKINHVQTVKDAEGLPVACDFDLTIYNRTKEDLLSATVEMTWTDETIEEFLASEEARTKREKEKQELKAEREKAAGIVADSSSPRLTRRAKTKPAQIGTETNQETLTFTVDIEGIPSYQQKVMSSRLDSDRCFMLIADAELNVRTCQSVLAQGHENANPAARGAKSSGCNNLFTLISSKDEQYYRDFKEIDLEAERLQRATKNELIRQELEANHKRTLEAMDSVSEVLKTIE